MTLPLTFCTARRAVRLTLLLSLTTILASTVRAALPAKTAESGTAESSEVGDAQSVPDPSRFDPAYPDMADWAHAGVAGGIPRLDGHPAFRTVRPGDDLQGAIDAAAASVTTASSDSTPTTATRPASRPATEPASAPSGVANRPLPAVVALEPGTYRLTTCLRMRSNVVLRGADRSAVLLESSLRSGEPNPQASIVLFDGVAHSGLERLTLQHSEVARLGLKVYGEDVAGPVNNPGGVKDLYVAGVTLTRADDCWLDRVSILHSGTQPLAAAGRRLTLRDVRIDGAFNKGETGAPAGSGNVAFSVSNGLLYRTSVKNTRHALVLRDTLAGETCTYNVILDCNFQGDVNFHGNRKDSGHNLFEGVLVRSLVSHGWPAWSYWKKNEIGPLNLSYRSLGWGGGAGDVFASTRADKVYTFTGMHDPNVLSELPQAPPKFGTLYSVTGRRPWQINPSAWPASATAAREAMLAREQMQRND